MAHSTKIIRRTEVDVDQLREQELRELEQQLMMHKDTLLKLFRLMDQLDDHEVFNALNAALAKSDPILTRVLKALNETELDKAIRNGLLLAQGLGKFKFGELEPMILKINKGFELSTNHNKTLGVFSLLKVLVSRDFIEGALFLTKFVEGFGYDADDLKVEQGIVDPVQTDTGDLKNVSKVKLPSQRKEKSSGNSNMVFGLAAGAVALSACVLLLRK
ncbi:DUF1641 domain-containing protein [Macrococcus equipercicus]|uniref:DUF1641 domain-containing protein n=1 Tax=Macrococcus equipercicus TaxID=69967 RepID=A0A9Q9F3P3_9STAP|nr:hypothetical protein [Macrococcus equipercicus]KAA1042538.1 hypothetical protein ERX35_001255 [Macrococcus equipercicus]UTH14399.1 hypothetical protein KFV11_03290 [Macrococcus equipercicus]